MCASKRFSCSSYVRSDLQALQAPCESSVALQQASRRPRRSAESLSLKARSAQRYPPEPRQQIVPCLSRAAPLQRRQPASRPEGALRAHSASYGYAKRVGIEDAHGFLQKHPIPSLSKLSDASAQLASRSVLGQPQSGCSCTA